MSDAEQGMYDMGLLLGTGNPLYWQCEKCGWKTARHPATKPEEMPACHQYAPAKLVGRKWNEYARRMEDVYQYHCGGKMVAKSLTAPNGALDENRRFPLTPKETPAMVSA